MASLLVLVHIFMWCAVKMSLVPFLRCHVSMDKRWGAILYSLCDQTIWLRLTSLTAPSPNMWCISALELKKHPQFLIWRDNRCIICEMIELNLLVLLLFPQRTLPNQLSPGGDPLPEKKEDLNVSNPIENVSLGFICYAGANTHWYTPKPPDSSTHLYGLGRTCSYIYTKNHRSLFSKANYNNKSHLCPENLRNTCQLCKNNLCCVYVHGSGYLAPPSLL